jgi:UDP-3-O-[3-hydroxymyristoyl] glucosamine N-acyltransferase
MQVTLNELATLVGGKIVGHEDGSLILTGAAPLAQAVTGQISLVDLRSECLPDLSNVQASAVITAPDSPFDALPSIRVEDVHDAFAKIILHFRPKRHKSFTGISPHAYLSPTAQVADNVEIHPYATIGDDVKIGTGTVIHAGVHVMAGCEIGENVTLFPGVVLYEETKIGDRTILHAGVKVGAYGFGYGCENGQHVLSAQLGNVVIGSDVEIGANSTIDRGTYGSTVISDGTKIDDLVMVAHNCQIGCHNMLCSQVGIAGSTTTGEYVVMAGQVGVRDHVHIGDRAILGAMAGVINDVPSDACVVGIPATPQREQMVKQAAFTKLPEMRKQIKILLRKVEKLEAALAEKPKRVA